jgi:hypothetical protein
MRYEIKELNVGGILDQAITLVKNHFALLFGIVAVLMIPVGILQAVFGALQAPAPVFPGGPPTAGGSPLDLLFLAINGLLVAPLTNAAILHALASEYLEKPTTTGQAFRRAFQVYFPYLGTVILMGLIIGLGFFLLIVGALIFSLWYCLSTQVVVIEGTYGPAALKRSHQLMKGNYGTMFVLAFLIGIVQFGLMIGLGLVLSGIVLAIVLTLVQASVFLFSSAAFVAFYFSCRCKHENFDLAMLAEAVGHEEPGAPSENPAS